MKKNLSISVETDGLFNQIVDEMSNKNPGITQGECFARVVKSFVNQENSEEKELKDQVNFLLEEKRSLMEALKLPIGTDLIAVESAYKVAEKTCEKLEEENRLLKEASSSSDENIQEKLREANTKLVEYEERYRNLEESNKLAVNQILLTIPTPTFEILTECCNRLTIRYNRKITPADLLLDVFIRYNVEQYNEWFYPFVIRKEEFKEITGFTHEEIKKWLSKGKEV